MSYILDALKKATAERELQRGSLPHLHTQPGRAGATVPASVRLWRSYEPVWWIGASVLSAGLLIWLWAEVVNRSTSMPAPASMTLTASAPMPALPPESASQQVVLPPPLPPEIPARTVSSLEQTLPVTRAVQPPASILPKATLVPKVSGLNTSITKTQLPALPGAAPKLIISGSTYSDNPAYRMLIINGQVFREGESVSADLILTQIHRRTAVVNYLGTSYQLAY